MEASALLKKIFNLAEQAHNHLFVREGSQKYKIRKQKFFPKGAKVVWKAYALYEDKDFTAWADPDNHSVSIFFPRENYAEVDEQIPIEAIFVHELTHVMQFNDEGYGHGVAETGLKAYLRASRGCGIFGGNLCAFAAFLVPTEVEALIYQGISMRRVSHGKSTAMEGLETVLNIYFLPGYEQFKSFARDNAIANIIPKHPRLLHLFSKEPEYTTALKRIKGKAKDLARAARLFVHLQNIVVKVYEKPIERALTRYKRAYAKNGDPAVFEKLLKRRWKKQRTCHAQT